MLLQLAVGPVCLFVFRAASRGFVSGESAVLAVCIIDSLYILLAVLGVTRWIQNEKVKKIFPFIGAIIIALFALDTGLSVFGKSFLPAFSPAAFSFSGAQELSAFLSALILTASNPLTILFWAGVFSTRMQEDHLNRKDLLAFSSGCVLATILFLTLVAAIGNFTALFLPETAIKILNLTVAISLLYFAGRMILPQRK